MRPGRLLGQRRFVAFERFGGQVEHAGPTYSGGLACSLN